LVDKSLEAELIETDIFLLCPTNWWH
jgi:hypothetical protein